MIFISPPEHEEKYLSDMVNELTFLYSLVILNVFRGVCRNIGVNDSEVLKKPSEALIKAAIPTFDEIQKRFMGFLGRNKDPLKKFLLQGIKLYREDTPIDPAGWERFNRQISAYLNSYSLDIAEEVAVKMVLLGVATEGKDADKTIEQIERGSFFGVIPAKIKSLVKRFKVKRDVLSAINRSYDQTYERINEQNEKIKAAIRNQIKIAHKQKKTPQQLASDLYWMKDTDPSLKGISAQALMRDWHRIAHTELKQIHETAKMAQTEDISRKSIKDPEKAVYFVYTGGTCPECKKRQGTIVRQVPLELVGDETDDSLSSRGIKDPHTDIAIWQGKNNIGYRVSQWRVCIPLHPWNTARWARIDPENEEYDTSGFGGRVRPKGAEEAMKKHPGVFEELIKYRDELDAKLLAREERMQADRDKGIHKRPSDYIEYKVTGELGTDSKGRRMVDVDGITYVAVDPADFADMLDEYRRNNDAPIPVASNQKAYKKIFG